MTGSRVALLAVAALPGLAQPMIQVTKPSDREIVITVSLSAPRQKVFDAMTRKDLLPRWFQPSRMSLDAYEPDVKPGGTTRFVFRRPYGKTIEMRHTYGEIEAPRRWTHVESYDFSSLRLTVTTELAERDGKTTLTQTVLYASQRERDEDFDPVATSAQEAYARLERFLQSPE